MKFGDPVVPKDDHVPNESGWGRTVLGLIRTVVSDLSTIFNKGIRFDEHVYGGIKEVPIVAGTYPVYFSVDTREVAAVWVGKIFEKSSATAAPTAGVWCDWEYVNGRVEISNITGLTSSAEYLITFVYLGA